MDIFSNLFGKKSTVKRTLPDLSVREIADHRAKVGSELRAALYWFDEKMFIASAISGIVEYGEPVVMTADVEDETLGLAVCDKLLDYKPQNNRDLVGYKVDDWLAYKVSGAKTAKHFENNAVYISISTMNFALLIEASPRVSNFPELKALSSTSISKSHTEIGEAVRRAIKASFVLREAGLI